MTRRRCGGDLENSVAVRPAGLSHRHKTVAATGRGEVTATAAATLTTTRKNAAKSMF